MAKLLGALGIRNMGFPKNKPPVFCHLNHAWKNAFYPYVFRHPLVTYTFDCWPYVYDQWEEVFRLNKPRIAFISARKSVEEMQSRIPEMDFRWLPEAGDPAGFNNNTPLSKRSIDVLEMGRSYQAYHDSIRMPLAREGIRHVFSAPENPIHLPNNAVSSTYAQAKVVACFPRSMTSPSQAGNVETTTFRYFECIFSKCLMVGHCPEELIQILGYNPVIEADMDQPAQQLLNEILPNIGRHQELVDRNHQTLVQKWTVDHQAALIHSALHEVSGHASTRRRT